MEIIKVAKRDDEGIALFSPTLRRLSIIIEAVSSSGKTNTPSQHEFFLGTTVFN